MTEQVISLEAEREERQPHITGAAKCVGCGHRWVAVAPVGAIELECPACGTMRGTWYGIVTQPVTWTCLRRMSGGTVCGNDLWTLSPKGARCARCGHLTPWDELGERMWGGE